MLVNALANTLDDTAIARLPDGFAFELANTKSVAVAQSSR